MQTINKQIATACAPAQDNIISTLRVTAGRSGPAESTPKPTPRSTPSTPSPSVFYFNYKGKAWRIFKRGVNYWIHFEDKRRNLRTNQSLGATAKEAAQQTAKIKIDAFLQDRLDVLKASLVRRPSAPAPVAYSTIAALCNAYETMPQQAAPVSRRRGAVMLRLIIRKALALAAWRKAHGPTRQLPDLLPTAAEVDTLKTSILTADLVRDYFDYARTMSEAAANDENRARYLKSGNSCWQQTCGIFADFALARYPKLGITLPDMGPFRTAGKAELFKGVPDEYTPAPDSLIRETLRQWARCPDRNIYLTIGLELACGLRAGETRQVTWGMFQRCSDGWLLDGRGRVKNRSGLFIVTPIDPFWRVFLRRIAREKWQGKPEELLLCNPQDPTKPAPGNLTRHVSDWMRALGWQTEKTNHELRKFSGSLVALQHGIYQAQRWLRQSDVGTTQQFYTRYIGERIGYRGLVRVS